MRDIESWFVDADSILPLLGRPSRLLEGTAEVGSADLPAADPEPLPDDVAMTTEAQPADATSETDDTPGVPEAAGAALFEDLPEAFGWPDGVVDAQQILRDRPDVYAAYYRDFFGPNNDRNSPAWVQRVGGTTAEDYALYWHRTHGVFEGYAPSRLGNALGAPVEWEGYSGRTTMDGIPIAKILEDRPDVFRAYFTEYYGPNNDRHSDAWVNRVGGTTIEDYANYWYNAHGKLEGYKPTVVERPEPAGALGIDAPEETQSDPEAPGAHPSEVLPTESTPSAGGDLPGMDPVEDGPDGQMGTEGSLDDEPGGVPQSDTTSHEQGDGASAEQAGPPAPREPLFWSDEGSPMLWPSSTSFFDPDPIG